MIQDIEDNYPDYVDDERGYAWDVWDVLAADVMRRHDDVLNSSPEALGRLDPGGLDDLDRWAYARASRRHGDLEGFLDAGRLIVASERGHRGIDYRGVFATIIETLAREGATDEARLLHEEMANRWPGNDEVERLHVFIALQFDEEHALEAVDGVLERRPDDAELFFELSEDAHHAGRPALAGELLRHAEESARRQGHTAILVDIELFKKQLQTTAE